VLELSAATLPWYLIGVFVTGLLAVFYGMMRGKLLSSRVVDRLLAAEATKAEYWEKASARDAHNLELLLADFRRVLQYAENTDRMMRVIYRRAGIEPPEPAELAGGL
jgi:hypothetical protein